MDDLIPGERPVDIEMAFGDPEAVEKAKANLKSYPFCVIHGVHCRWKNECDNDPFWVCPIENEED